MKVAISAETTIDLTNDLIKDNNIYLVPFQILLGDENKNDGEITSDEIIEFVNNKNVLPKTGAVNEITYTEHFDKLLKEYDAVIHFSLSSFMSSAYNNAVSASEKFKNVYIIDTQSLSTGIALLALYAKKLVDEGMNVNEIVEKVTKRISYVQASFVLKRLDYLYKGGRCSALSYFGANILKIKPQIIVANGKMGSGNKYRGTFAHCVECYCKDTLDKFNTPDLSCAFITYTTATQDVIDIAYNMLKDKGFENIYITRAGGTITSHCGENCLGILYINDGI